MTNTTKPADQTITWDDAFRPFRAVIRDGVISEYCRETLVGQWSATRAKQFDQNTVERYDYDFGADEGCPEYSCGPVGKDTVAWIDGVAYLLTETEASKAIDIEVDEIE